MLDWHRDVPATRTLWSSEPGLGLASLTRVGSWLADGTVPALAVSVREMLVTRQPRKMLVDVRRTTGLPELSAADARAFWPAGPVVHRVAFLAATGAQWTLSQAIAAAGRDAGHVVQVFDTEATAVDWLIATGT